MALSGSIINSFATGYRLQLDWTATQNTPANTSTVTANLKLISLGSGYLIYSSVNKTGHIIINGTSYASTAIDVNLSGNQTKTLFTKSVTINHNPDGTGSFTLDGDLSINVTLNGTFYGTVSLTGQTFTLNTIPTGNTITSFPSFTIGNGVTASATRYTTSYTNTFQIWAGATLIKSKSGQGTTCTFSATDLDGIYSTITTKTSTTVTLKVLTYDSNNNQIGVTDTQDATALVGSDIVPVVSSAVLAEVDSQVSLLNLGTGRFVKGLSDLRFSITATGAKSSTITSFKVVLNNANYTSATSPITITDFNASGTFSPAIYAIDSRGRTSAAFSIGSIIVLDYAAPSITGFLATRASSPTTSVNVSITLGQVSELKNSSGIHVNKLKYKLFSKPKSESNWTTFVDTELSLGVLTLSSIPGSPFSISPNGYQDTIAYDFKIELTDSVGATTATSTYYVPTSTAVISWGTDGVAIGKIYEEAASSTLQIQGQADISTNVTANSTLISQSWSWLADTTNWGLSLNQIHNGTAIDYAFKIRNGSATNINALYLKSNGNIGIGTASPAAKLEVTGNIISRSSSAVNTASDMRLYGGAYSGNPATAIALSSSSGANNLVIGGGSSIGEPATAVSIATGTSGSLGIGTERMKIDSSGNIFMNTDVLTVYNGRVGLGTAAPSYAVHSVENAWRIERTDTTNTLGWVVLRNLSTSAGVGLLNLSKMITTTDTTGYFLTCTNGLGSTQMRVMGNGNLQNLNNSYGAISDIKLKENIVDATDKLEKINKVKIRKYNLIGDDLEQIGVIAQELEQVFPSLVDETPDYDENGVALGTTTKSVKYSVFIPILIKSIQELSDKVKYLENKLMG